MTAVFGTLFFGIEELIECLMAWILSLKKDANSLHLLIENNSGDIGTGGLVNLSTANKMHELLVFLLMISEKKIVNV